MKSNRTILLLFLVFGGLIGLLVLRSSVDEGIDESVVYADVVEGLGVDSIEEITLAQGDNTLKFIKENQQWRVGDYLADPSKVRQLLTGLLEPEDVVIVSETGTQHESLDIASDSATLALLVDGDKNLELLLGGFSGNGRYVRVPDQDRVYLVDPLSRRLDTFNLDQWVDMDITRIPQDLVEQLTISYNNEELVLSQQENGWFVEGNEQALETTILQPVLNSLAAFASTDLVLEEDRDAYATTSYLTTEVITEGAENPVILTFYRGDEDVLVTHSDRQGAFAVSTQVAERFELTEDDLTFAEVGTEEVAE